MKAKARRRRAKARANLPVYIIAGVLLAVVAFLFYNIWQGSRGASTGAKSWSEPPAMTIDVNKSYTAAIETDKGEIVLQLLPQAAPQTVNSFVFLARQGYYDGVTFHRVLPGFMAQGGDPTGTGSGDPGYMIPNEEGALLFDSAGVLAMANSGRDRNGSQFFITYAPQPSLDGGYTIFGRVISGMDVVQALTPRDPDNPADTAPGDPLITIRITEQ